MSQKGDQKGTGRRGSAVTQISPLWFNISLFQLIPVTSLWGFCFLGILLTLRGWGSSVSFLATFSLSCLSLSISFIDIRLMSSNLNGADLSGIHCLTLSFAFQFKVGCDFLGSVRGCLTSAQIYLKGRRMISVFVDDCREIVSFDELVNAQQSENLIVLLGIDIITYLIIFKIILSV